MVKKKDEIPEWVADEIKNAEFNSPTEKKQTGYILEVYNADKKMDVQLYKPVEDGRHIITMDMPEDNNPQAMEKGVMYEFIFEQYKAPLSDKVSQYLKQEKEIDMAAIYRFVFKTVELLDVCSNETEKDDDDDK